MRIAVIGAGAMGHTHAEVLSTMPDVEVMLVARSVSPVTAALIERLGIEQLPSVDAALRRTDLDGVLVATPTDQHHDMVLAAARAGKQIICEKPLARTM